MPAGNHDGAEKVFWAQRRLGENEKEEQRGKWLRAQPPIAPITPPTVASEFWGLAGSDIWRARKQKLRAGWKADSKAIDLDKGGTNSHELSPYFER
jgi:hypothetical protein